MKTFEFLIYMLGVMFIVFSAGFILAVISGITYYKHYPQEHPVVNLPETLRQENYNNGSCVWATTVSLLRWQDQYKMANWVRKARSGGVAVSEILQSMEKAGFRFSGTDNGDVAFLEWACQTRRGAAIVIHGGAHMVALVDMNQKRVCILDNNDIKRYKWMDREAVIKDWKKSGGIAFTPVYSPTSPLP